MRFIIAFLMLTCPMFGAETLKPKVGQNTYNNYNEARTAAAKDPDKRLFCMFTAGWCQPCQQMKSDVIFNKQIWESMNKYAVVYFVDVDNEAELAQIYKDSGSWKGNLPTCFLYSKDTKFILGTLEGYTSIENFAKWWEVAAQKDKGKQEKPPIIEESPSRQTNEMSSLAKWLKDVCSQEEIRQLVALLIEEPKPMLIYEPTSLIEDKNDNISK